MLNLIKILSLVLRLIRFQKKDLSASEDELELRAEVEKEDKKAQQTPVKKKK